MNIYFVLFLAYILVPKIDLIGNGSMLVRPEDIISALAFVIYLVSKKRFPLLLPTYVKLYGAFIAISYAAAIINISSMGLTGFVYSTRLIQYLIWFFIMYEACHTVTWKTFRYSFIAVCVIFVMWSGLEISGAIGRVGRFTEAEGRLTINTSGPFETSVMLAMLGYSVPSLLLTPIMFVLVLLTQARITLVGMIFSAGAAKPLKALAAGIVAAVLFTVVAQPLLAKLQDTRLGQSDSPARMAEVFAISWIRAPVLDNPIDFRERFLNGPTIYRYMVSTKKGDRSFGYRAVRWPIVIKTSLASPIHFLFGWSPGSWGVALDCYYVRAFGETGIVGLIMFLVWLGYTIVHLRMGSIARFSLVMIAIVASFIDIFSASKVMPILWAFLALDHARHPFAMPMRRWRKPSLDPIVTPRLPAPVP
ncbi:hypothetical protein N4G62_13315 [Sphingomonas sanguinis]|uniref:O-antigen polymerase n=1 Tax=Sphingomonas sanguinis TaxID=33051 RepID=A0ABU5LSX2_9SPHN|nr:hypothetical protein [Sphingomonas sanguinis]MDZ7283006.1 hypothetical protein [Sphingomonas sanguinis]